MGEYLGIELGSTRIKAVVIGEGGEVLASGSCARENRPLDGGVWTYDLADVPKGLAAAYGACADGGDSALSVGVDGFRRFLAG